MLAEWAREHADAGPEFFEAVERRRDELQADAMALGARLYAEKPGAFVASPAAASGRPRRQQLGHPNTIPGVRRREHSGSARRRRAARGAGPFEVWAARAWNVFNEGRPFSIVYPLLVLLAAAPLGPGAGRAARARAAGRGGLALVLSRFPFPLRGRALLWLAALAAVPLLEPWRAPALLAGALAGYVFFTVVVWGSVYYHLRTGRAVDERRCASGAWCSRTRIRRAATRSSSCRSS